MDYRRIVKQGHWVHKTKENAVSLEVVGCDYHRKTVTLSSGETMSMDNILKTHMIPTPEGIDIGRFEKMALLGNLDKESNQPRENIEVYKDVVDQVIEQANTNTSTEIPIEEKAPAQTLSTEDRMVLDAITMSSGEETTIKADVDITFGFDINKIVKLTKMFKIDSDKVVDIILSSEDGIDSLKSILKGVVDNID